MVLIIMLAHRRSFPTLSTDACDGCLSVTHELTKGLMVELIRCWVYFKRENRDLKRSHSSEKLAQDEDKRYARSSIVVNKLRLHWLSTCLMIVEK